MYSALVIAALLLQAGRGTPPQAPPTPRGRAHRPDRQLGFRSHRRLAMANGHAPER